MSGARGRRRRWPPHHHLLVGCFVVVIACFVVSATTSELRARDTDEPVVALARTMLPAVMHLAAVRTQLHVMENLVEEAADGHAWGRGSLQKTRSLASEEWGLYLEAAPTNTPGRLRAEQALDEAAAAMDLVRGQLLEEDFHGARDLLLTRLRPAFVEVDRAIDDLTASHVRAAEQLLRGAQQERRHASRMALVWNTFSVGLAVLLGVLGVRAVRRHARLLEARASELEQFADRVAHDIRGPLHPILLAFQMGQRDSGSSPSTRQAMERGIRSVQAVQSLLADLLEFARSGARPAPDASAELGDVLRETLAEIRPLAESHRVRLTVGTFEECTVACGPGLVACVASNLLRNAIIHMGDASRRRVSVRVLVTQEVRIEVTDTGPGMSEDLADTVFEPRARGARGVEGLGLGLATVRRLVEAHGGQVGVRSRVAHGSTFWVTLPRRA